MEEAAALREHDVAVQLRRHQPREMRDLDGVRQHVLSVARTIAHPPQQTYQLGMNTVHARLERRLLPRFLDALINLAACLLDHLFDACRMNASILNQLFERDPRHLTAYGIKARKNDRLGRIVDDEVDARQRLQGADVAPLAPDDAALHLIVRQSNDRDRRLRHVIGGTALDGDTQNLTCCLVRLVLRLLDIFFNLTCLFMLQLFLRLCHEHGACLLGGQPRDALELLPLAIIESADLCLRLVDACLLTCEAFLLLLDGFQLAVEVLLLLNRTTLHALQFTAAFLRVTLKVLPLPLDLLLGFEQCFLPLRLRRLPGLVDNAFCFTFG